MGDLYGNDSGGIMEKLDHSIFIDLLTIGVLGYISWALYSMLDFGQSIFDIGSTDPNILALQLSIVLIVIYSLEFLHDRISG